jgi:hypothetical protein
MIFMGVCPKNHGSSLEGAMGYRKKGPAIICQWLSRQIKQKNHKPIVNTENETVPLWVLNRSAIMKNKPTFIRKTIYSVLISLGMLTASQSLANTITAPGYPGKGNNCMNLKKPDVLVCDAAAGCIFRDEFTADQLVALATKLVHDYSVSKDCDITLPAISWTGLIPIPTLQNIPSETINIKSLSSNQLAERLLSLALLTIIEVDNTQIFIPSNDRLALLKDGPYAPGRGKYLSKMADLMDALFVQGQAGTLPLEDARLIGLGLGVTHLRNLAERYDDPNNAFENIFNQTYSDYIHRYYNQLAQFATAGAGRMVNGDYYGGASTAIIPNQAQLTPAHSQLRVSNLEYEALAKEKIVTWEAEAVGKYFWPRVFVDPTNAMVFSSSETDPDGYVKPDDFTLLNYDLPSQAMRWEWLAQLSAPFKSLLVISPSRLTPTATYASQPSSGTRGIMQIVQEENPGDSAAATKILNDMEVIWNSKIAPAYAALSQIAAVRRTESSDDFYAGSWRAKIKKVISVQHDADNIKAVSADVLLADGTSATVPLGGARSSSKTISKIQDDIAEMDGWFERNLAVAQNVRAGDNFSLLFKKDPSKGICGGDLTGTTPYTSVTELIDNYGAETKIVAVDASLADLVFQSGYAGAKFFYDLKEYLADQHVKTNYAQYGFTNAESAGLCKTNPQGQLITYDKVRDDLNALAKGSLATSDVGVLGRHYGYNADGTRKDDEWTSNTQLKYTFQPFDFIYRQHYAINTAAPLTASNIVDPQTGKQFYQYTNVGDTRRAAFISAFSQLETRNQAEILSNKPGSYFRWKMDWVAQKISGFVIANAVSKNILSQSFIDEYFSGTFVDTNDPTGVQCGFGLQHTSPETLSFRVVGQTSGSANSSSYLDLTNKIFNVRMSFGSLNPVAENTISNTIGTLLHEGALGHGFDRVPNVMDQFRGATNEVSWLTNVNSSLVRTDLPLVSYPFIGPSYATLGEGWATYGETLGVVKQLNVLFDDNGCPNAANINNVGVFVAMSSLSRIAARQVISVAENYSQYAWSIYHSVSEFRRLTDLVGANAAAFNMRFISHPTQQTTYAAGLITNLGILGFVKEEATKRGPNCRVNEPAYNELRITRTDYIIGALLQKFIEANLDSLIKCD